MEMEDREGISLPKSQGGGPRRRRERLLAKQDPDPESQLKPEQRLF